MQAQMTLGGERQIDLGEYPRGSNRVNATASSAKTRVKVA
jgi:hypothetical protein